MRRTELEKHGYEFQRNRNSISVRQYGLLVANITLPNPRPWKKRNQNHWERTPTKEAIANAWAEAEKAATVHFVTQRLKGPTRPVVTVESLYGAGKSFQTWIDDVVDDLGERDERIDALARWVKSLNIKEY